VHHAALLANANVSEKSVAFTFRVEDGTGTPITLRKVAEPTNRLVFLYFPYTTTGPESS
jgi:hypothetical protein